MGSEKVVCNPGCFSQLQSWPAMSIYHMAQDRKHCYSIKAENPAAAVQRGQSCLSVQHGVQNYGSSSPPWERSDIDEFFEPRDSKF
jgi:hypothetical protein